MRKASKKIPTPQTLKTRNSAYPPRLPRFFSSSSSSCACYFYYAPVYHHHHHHRHRHHRDFHDRCYLQIYRRRLRRIRHPLPHSRRPFLRLRPNAAPKPSSSKDSKRYRYSSCSSPLSFSSPSSFVFAPTQTFYTSAQTPYLR